MLPGDRNDRILLGRPGPPFDCRSLEVTAWHPEAVHALERCVWSLLLHRADAPQHLSDALEHDPGLALGHILRGFQLRLLARRELAPQIESAIEAARTSVSARGGTSREHLLLTALSAWHAGESLTALQALRAASEAHPDCLLSMKLLHAVSFIYGKLQLTRGNLERCLSALEGRTAGYGLVLGCYAFALQEAGFVAQAQQAALDALEIGRDDVWAFHALLHVFSSQQDNAEALALLRRCDDRFVDCNNFRAHLAWHHALIAAARGEHDEALALYDRQLVGGCLQAPGLDYRDLANCVSLLVRLERGGVHVGSRYEALADLAELQIGNHQLAFADAHYLLALLGAGRSGQARRFLDSSRAQLAHRKDEDAVVYARTGLPLLLGVCALYTDGPELPLRALAALNAASLQELGGSHVQRALFLQLSRDAFQRMNLSESNA
jgi:hypothetical protein